MNWKDNLSNFFQDLEGKHKAKNEQENENKKLVFEFINQAVKPAFEEIRLELEKYGRTVEYHLSNDDSLIEIKKNGSREFKYEIKVNGKIAFPVTFFESDGKYYSSQGNFRSGAQIYGVDSITKDEIINHLLNAYKEHINFK